MSIRGTSNGNASGSAAGRRRRKLYLLAKFGNGVVAPCMFPDCGELVDFVTLSVDRIVPGCRGGTYRRENIRPACGPCNSKHGGGIRAGSDPAQTVAGSVPDRLHDPGAEDPRARGQDPGGRP